MTLIIVILICFIVLSVISADDFENIFQIIVSFIAWVFIFIFLSFIGIIIFFLSPVSAKESCVIIYANDMGNRITKEIRDHEYAHCNGWKHPPGWKTYNKAYVPLKKYLKKYPGNVYEVSVDTKEARERCQGNLGCSTIIQE